MIISIVYNQFFNIKAYTNRYACYTNHRCAYRSAKKFVHYKIIEFKRARFRNVARKTFLCSYRLAFSPSHFVFIVRKAASQFTI